MGSSLFFSTNTEVESYSSRHGEDAKIFVKPSDLIAGRKIAPEYVIFQDNKYDITPKLKFDHICANLRCLEVYNSMIQIL